MSRASPRASIGALFIWNRLTACGMEVNWTREAFGVKIKFQISKPRMHEVYPINVAIEQGIPSRFSAGTLPLT